MMQLRSILPLLAISCLLATGSRAQPGARFEIEQSGQTYSVQCAAGEPVRHCADAAAALFGKLRGTVESPALFGTDLRSVATDPVADAAPALWSRSTAAIDPRRLPLGNGRVRTDQAAPGFVFACDPYMYAMPVIIGAQRTGPWVDETRGSYDMTGKVFDLGRVEWQGWISISERGTERVIEGNGLPVPGVPTGLFPVPARDPAYRYDRNPFAITAQRIHFAVPLHPEPGPAPRCVYKEVGITLDGVALHAGLDSSGRDENAYELTDVCGGKPQPGGGYHRHTLSACTPHIDEPRVVVGYALDGYPITGPFEPDGTELNSAALDICHGTTSEIMWDGRAVSTYHYVLTRDFPYSVACFRGTPTPQAFPPLPGAPPRQDR